AKSCFYGHSDICFASTKKSSASSSSKEKSEGEKCGIIKKNGDFKANGVCEEGTKCLCPEDPNCSGKVKCYCEVQTTMGTMPTETTTIAPITFPIITFPSNQKK
ncbi:unnamed protein product, partial [Owenia fusiformis]